MRRSSSTSCSEQLPSIDYIIVFHELTKELR